MKYVLGLIVSFALVGFSAAEVNKSKAQKVAVPFDKCKPEKGVKFKGYESTKISTEELEDLLLGNTILSVDRYGTFAIYYPEKGKSVGWMPKEKSEGYSWSAGDVTFENDKYCRTWKEWKSGKKINCWEAHRGEDHVDTAGFYFVCGDGTPGGDVHVVLPGNIFEIEYKGKGAKSGKLTQDDELAKEITIRKIKKCFSCYVSAASRKT